MAIWDDVKTEEKVLSADSDKCMNCGSRLVYDIKTNSLHCDSCGTDCYPEAFKIRRLIDRNDKKDTAEGSGKTIVHEEVVCNACGASIVAGKNTASTVCAFCGSPAIVTRRLSQEFRPDYIIPFVLDHDEVKAKVKEWLEARDYLPNGFVKKMTMTDLTPMYVPFWLVDADCVIDLEATGSVDHHNCIEFYNCKRKGMFKMHNVPFDGSRKIRDDLMENIEPFDYTSVAPYSDGYLQGYYAEKYDLSTNDMADRIAFRFREFISEQDELLAINSNDKSIHYDRFTIDTNRSEATNLNCKYAFLPVWFARIQFEGVYYSVAINGQTGKVSGNIPDSGRKVDAAVKAKSVAIEFKHVGVITLILLLIAAFLIVFMKAGIGGDEMKMLGLVFLSAVICIGVMIYFTLIKRNSGPDISAFAVKKHYDQTVAQPIQTMEKKLHNTNTRPPAYVYMNSSEKVVLEGTDVMDHTGARFTGSD